MYIRCLQIQIYRSVPSLLKVLGFFFFFCLTALGVLVRVKIKVVMTQTNANVELGKYSLIQHTVLLDLDKM